MFQNDDKGRNSEGPDVLSEAAMINAYYICHNVQVGCIWLKKDHPPRQVQVHLSSASSNLALTRGTLADSAKFTSPQSWT